MTLLSSGVVLPDAVLMTNFWKVGSIPIVVLSVWNLTSLST
jgi:hypothetical protein